ncbi:hypothetical protein C8R44DRAFT_748256 [Mycena epipterygia]|nr:hypothetical protein C8R44DRAFT_748256 [Mycena epipterygia]
MIRTEWQIIGAGGGGAGGGRGSREQGAGDVYLIQCPKAQATQGREPSRAAGTQVTWEAGGRGQEVGMIGKGKEERAGKSTQGGISSMGILMPEEWQERNQRVGWKGSNTSNATARRSWGTSNFLGTGQRWASTATHLMWWVNDAATVIPTELGRRLCHTRYL